MSQDKNDRQPKKTTATQLDYLAPVVSPSTPISILAPLPSSSAGQSSTFVNPKTSLISIVDRGMGSVSKNL